MVTILSNVDSIPQVVSNYLQRLVSGNPNYSILNLLGKLMDDINGYRVIDRNSLDAIGNWLLTDNNTTVATRWIIDHA
ncbi:hypothetical protein [Fructilactobacillus florum]|uniref:hypothetical protein n=1 Tax=Fructilactobacillus florum TaxID=640331 RepID=UPI0006D0FC45|nr:hypothetical protein [Fructilactobacillus florum]